MKLATFATPDGPRIGAAAPETDGLLDLATAARALGRPSGGALTSMLALIESGDAGLALAHDLVAAWPAAAASPLSRARLMAPLPRPTQMRDCLVFEQHLLNAQAEWERRTGKPAAPIPDIWYQRPTWYKCNRMSVVGHEHDVQWPPYSEMMDFELELACVIGKQGRDIPAARGLDHVFGFTIFNDFSARDTQMIERPLGMGPMKGKDFDTGNVLGPWIVTRDEMPDPHHLTMTVRINGERWGGGNSSAMQHKFHEILAFISVSETLYPGEVIASGTVGTGCGLEQGRYLKPNDVVELEIEGIGVLRNRIVRPAAGAP
jgi:2-keto-4-pentenoate hydratase/2-oxohepta-3-ene-1,7-dioic acid hydratase in catechol pathway